MPTVQGYCMAGGPLVGKGIPVPTEPRPRPDSRPAVVVLASIHPGRVATPAGVAGPELAPLVRAWAREQGRVIGDRGRLPQSLIDAYLKATA